MKYLILGGRSYLGKSFSQYLEKSNNQVITLNELNSNFYSTNVLKEVINNENPQKIVDFKLQNDQRLIEKISIAKKSTIEPLTALVYESQDPISLAKRFHLTQQQKEI